MMEKENSPAWLLPLIVIILIASIVLLFVASRSTLQDGRGVSGRSGDGLGYERLDRKSTTAPVDPCNLISQSQVSEILGQSVGSPNSENLNNPFGERVCVFPASAQANETLVAIDVVFEQGIDPILFDSGYDVIEMYRSRKIPDRQLEDIDGIDDEAFWGGSGPELWNGLHVRSADVYLRVQIYMDDSDQALDAARRIAVIALQNIFG